MSMASSLEKRVPLLDQDLYVLSSTATPLVYRPLDSTKSEIRLLRIAPSLQVDSVIKGTLDHVPIDHHSPYEALSYTWADDRADADYDWDNELDHYILLEGHYFPVESNLFAALRQLRLPSE